MFEGFTGEEIAATRASVDKFHEENGRQNARVKPERLTKGNNSSPSLFHTTDKTKPVLSNSELIRRQQRSNAYRLRHAQRDILGDIHDTLKLCGLGIIENPDGSPGTGRFACSHETGAIIQSGVMTCHSPFACPVCAPKVAARRALALKPQIEARVKDGWSVSLLTLTVRHRRKLPLGDIFHALSKAWARVTSGKKWQKFRTVGPVEFVRGYDVTYSDRHGWHPHLHICLLLGPEHDEEVISEEILTRWRLALASLGWSTTREAQHFDRADDPEKAAKYAVTPAAVYESLAMSMKKSRGKSSGLTPFEILERAVADKGEGVEKSRWIGLWREYVAATKGRRQVVVSQGLDLDPPEETDDMTPLDVVLQVPPGTLREMDEINLIPDVLANIDDHIGDPYGMREALKATMERLRSTEWTIPSYGPEAANQFRVKPDHLDIELSNAGAGRRDLIRDAMERFAGQRVTHNITAGEC